MRLGVGKPTRGRDSNPGSARRIVHPAPSPSGGAFDPEDLRPAYAHIPRSAPGCSCICIDRGFFRDHLLIRSIGRLPLRITQRSANPCVAAAARRTVDEQDGPTGRHPPQNTRLTFAVRSTATSNPWLSGWSRIFRWLGTEHAGRQSVTGRIVSRRFRIWRRRLAKFGKKIPHRSRQIPAAVHCPSKRATIATIPKTSATPVAKPPRHPRSVRVTVVEPSDSLVMRYRPGCLGKSIERRFDHVDLLGVELPEKKLDHAMSRVMRHGGQLGAPGSLVRALSGRSRIGVDSTPHGPVVGGRRGGHGVRR